MQIERTSGWFTCNGLLSLLLGLVSVATACAGEPQVFTIARQLEEMGALDRTLSERAPDTERFRRLVEFYDARFAIHQTPGALSNLSDVDLRALMLAAQLAVFYSHSDDILDDAMADLRQPERRGDVGVADKRAAYQLLVANRRFDEARSFLDAQV